MKKNKFNNQKLVITENILKNTDLLIKRLNNSFKDQKEFLKEFGKKISNYFEKRQKGEINQIKEIPLFDELLSILPDIIILLGIPLCHIFYKQNYVNKLIDLYFETNDDKIKTIINSWYEVLNFLDTNLDLFQQLIEIGFIERKENIDKNKNYEQIFYQDIFNLLYNLGEFNNEKKNIDIEEIPKYEKEYNNIKKEMKKFRKYNNISKAQYQFYQELVESVGNSLKTIMNNQNFINLKEENLNKENEIMDNNLIKNKEIEEITNIPLEKRTYFFLNEKIKEKRNQYIEFQDYPLPLDIGSQTEIKKILCSFLNSEGGRLYIGINQTNSNVKGVILNYKNRDNLRNSLINLTYDFYPKCRLDKIFVYFIPIKDIQTKNFIPKKYVIKIRIFRGDPEFLYSMTKTGYTSFIRNKEECLEMTTDEISEEIIDRDKKKYNKDYDKNQIILKENDIKDPDPEINQKDLEDDYDEIPIFGKDNSNNNKNKIKEKEQYKKKDNKKENNNNNNNQIIIKVTNIDENINLNDLNRFFNQTKCSGQKMNKGYGFLYFSNKNSADNCLVAFNGKKVGNKIIKLDIVNHE